MTRVVSGFCRPCKQWTPVDCLHFDLDTLIVYSHPGFTMTKRTKPKPGNAKRAIAYLRLSKEDAQGHSPDRQMLAITTWAAARGYEVVASFFDNDVSGGAPLAKRPALAAAVASLASLDCGVVLMQDRDRLARDVEIAPAIERAVSLEGAKVETCDGMSGGTGVGGFITRTAKDMVSHAYRLDISEKTKGGLAVARAKGVELGGWRHVDTAEEAAAKADARRLADAGLSLRKIAAQLEQLGHRTRTGKPLSHTQVARILSA
jgi:DNA invertase Pin-like site-specific DNA recombinase